MSTITAPVLMTETEFDALPENGMTRMLIQGVLWEKPMTVRNPNHSSVLAEVTRQLGNWVKHQPKPRGRVLVGEAGFRLRQDPASKVGIDAAYISPELAAATPRGAGVVHGVPILAVEVLSPSTTQQEITAKVEEYLDAGVKVVWVIDPDFRSVAVHRPGVAADYFNVHKQVSGDPELPGLTVAVADLFDD